MNFFLGYLNRKKKKIKIFRAPVPCILHPIYLPGLAAKRK